MERNSILRLGVLVLITPIFFTQLFAQDILWEKSLGGKHADVLTDVISTPDYGFLIAGSSLSDKSGNKSTASQGDMDYCIWKMNEKGDLEWQKSFGGAGVDLLQSVKLTRDGGFILAGVSSSDADHDKKDKSFGNDDLWIIKLNAKGEIEWQHVLGGSGQEKLQTIQTTADGGYLLGASSSSYASEEDNQTPNLYKKSQDSFGSLDYWIVKLDKEGKISWQKTLGGQYLDELKSLSVQTNGNIILGGYSNSPVSGNKTSEQFGLGDYWLIALDKNGSQIWQKTLGGIADDQLFAITNSKDGGFIVGGNSNSTSSSTKKGDSKDSDFWVIKFNKDYEEEWQQAYDYGKRDVLTSIIENKDGTLLIAGYAQSENIQNHTKKAKQDKEGINDYIALKTKANGEELWSQIVGSKGDEVMRKALETRDGGYVLAGTSNGASSRDKNSGNGGNDFWIVKLKDKDKPEAEKLPLEAFPNPASSFTNIVIGYDYTEGEAQLFDINGRKLQTHKLTGNRTLPVDMSNLPIGVYLIKITSDKEEHSVKIIKN